MLESDVSPAIGSRFPVWFCLACVSRATSALILLWLEKIRIHRMRHPSEHVSPVPNYVALILIPDEVRRQEMSRSLRAPFFFFNLLVCLLESDVSPAIGSRFPVLGVCLESDVSPAIGIRFPVCVLFGVH